MLLFQIIDSFFLLLQDVCLKRLYKQPECKTSDDADRCNLYYAPRHVNADSYAAVILRKFEIYRRRLRRAQANLRQSCSKRRRRRCKAIELTPDHPRDRAGRRVKGARVVKRTTLGWKHWAERKMTDDPFVSACRDIWLSLNAKETGKLRSLSKIKAFVTVVINR